MVPLQVKRSERSLSEMLNFPFLIGIWKPKKLNSMVIRLPVAGQLVTMVVKEWVKSRAVRGLIDAEQQLLALRVLARIVGAARAGKGGRARQEHQQAYADH